MILTCGDWFFNKKLKRTMQADTFDAVDLEEDWIEPTPLLVGDLEKNGFKLEEIRRKVYYSKYINNNKGIFVENDLKAICVLMEYGRVFLILFAKTVCKFTNFNNF